MVIIDLRGISDAADYFVICTGTSEPHVRALAGDVVATLREAGHKPWHVEGTESLRWVLVDLVDIVIHIFGKEARGFYALERLWGDGAMTRFAIDYSKCMFCALCVPPCPTDCIHMGNLHDMSSYDRESMTVEFTDLAKEGLQTPQPLWLQKEKLPEWAAEVKQDWVDRGEPLKEEMIKALSPSQSAKDKEKAAAKAQPPA